MLFWEICRPDVEYVEPVDIIAWCFVHLYPANKRSGGNNFRPRSCNYSKPFKLKQHLPSWNPSTYGKLNFYGQLWETEPESLWQPMGVSLFWLQVFFQVLHSQVSWCTENKNANFLVFFHPKPADSRPKKKALCHLSRTRNKGLVTVMVGSFLKSFMYVGDYTNLY